MSNIKKYMIFCVLISVTQITLLHACATINNAQIILSDRDKELMREFDTLEIGFHLLRQNGQSIPTFKTFMYQKLERGESFPCALSQAKNLVVNSLKDQLIQTLLSNRALYGNIYGPEGKIQDPVIQYVKDCDIKSWFQINNNQAMSEQNQIALMNEPIYEENEEEQDSLDEGPYFDWWTVSHEGVLGYRSSISMNEMSDNSDCY